MNLLSEFQKIDDYRWILPPSFRKGMNVPVLVIASHDILKQAIEDEAIGQLINVASLPGIVKYAIGMPDIHRGYGFPIGGVAAFDHANGIISPGGVGYDINCGVRLIKTNIKTSELRPVLQKLIDTIFDNVPCGVGRGGKIKVDNSQLNDVMSKGSAWAVKNGYGWEDDIENTEDNGTFQGANPDFVSKRAKQRGLSQLGSLGAGNHFIEIEKVAEIYDYHTANIMGLEKSQVMIMIHTGSRGLGYQVCDDYLRIILKDMGKYGINVPDRQLASVPLHSESGKRYMGAMACAANFAWANRQIITFWVRESFERVFSEKAYKLGMEILYDITHNIAKIEEHIVNGKKRKLIVHRKGATRAFPKHHPMTPLKYQNVGQPIILPGDMGTMSFLLVGNGERYEETFASSAHGAGRVLSRRAARKKAASRNISLELKRHGITLKARSPNTVSEEIPDAYKNVQIVADSLDKAGIAKKVARLVPIGVVKG